MLSIIENICIFIDGRLKGYIFCVIYKRNLVRFGLDFIKRDKRRGKWILVERGWKIIVKFLGNEEGFFRVS